VKLCTYRSDDKSVIRSRKCWMMKPQRRIKWNRGDDDSAFDVRLFEPGAFELPICMKRDIRDSLRVEISPRKSKKCVTPIVRVFVPVKQWKPGARVLVNRSDDKYWYPATILSLEGSNYRIQLANGRVVVEDAYHIAGDKIMPGKHIDVNWKRQGRWYRVQVKSRTDQKITVLFDNGDIYAPTLAEIRLASDDMMKLPQPSIK